MLIHWDMAEGLLLQLMDHIHNSNHSILHVEKDLRYSCCCFYIVVEPFVQHDFVQMLKNMDYFVNYIFDKS